MASFADAIETQLMIRLCDFSGLLAMSEAKIHALATKAGLDASERDALWGAVRRWRTAEHAAGHDGDVSSDDSLDHGQTL